MNYQSNELNVLFSSDDNYAQHLGAAIYSLLYHNKDFKTISIYIIDNEISSRNRRNLEQVVEEFHYAKIAFLDFTAWKSKLHLNLAWEISLTAYARLFVAELLPMSVQRVLYLDCDMIICDDLYELWNTDLNRNMLGAVQDFVSENTKTCVGLDANDVYLNSGMLLIDLSQWRDNQIGKECLDYLNIKHGTVCHHDQGVLNGVFRSQWAIMPLRYNVMTIHYIFSSLQMKKYFDDSAEFYSEEEIQLAKEKPVILHFTPSFTSRPWFSNCTHPFKNKYWEALSATPWHDAKPQKDTSKWYVKLQGWRYRHFPV